MMFADVDVAEFEQGVMVRLANGISRWSDELADTYPDAVWAQREFVSSGAVDVGMVVPYSPRPGLVVCDVLAGAGFTKDDDHWLSTRERVTDALRRVSERYSDTTIVVDADAWSLLDEEGRKEFLSAPFVVCRDGYPSMSTLPEPGLVASGGSCSCSDMRDHKLTFSPKGKDVDFDFSRIRPVTNNLSGSVKPLGGVWLSVDDGWERWCSSEAPDWIVGGTCECVLTEDAKILEIRTMQDVSSLPQCVRDGFLRGTVKLDFEALSEEYDGVFIDVNGDGTNELYEMFYTWDCPSLVLFSPDTIAYVGELMETDFTREARVEAALREVERLARESHGSDGSSLDSPGGVTL